MITLMRLFATCAILLALACSTPAQQPPASAGQPNQAPSDVAARVGDRTITLKELDDREKARQKVTLRLRLERAGLDIAPRSFWIASLICGLCVGLGLAVAAPASVWIR